MIDLIMLRISEWRDYLKQHDLWDKGDCTIMEQIAKAVQIAYGPPEPTETEQEHRSN